MAKKYRLLKDLPDCEAGTLFEPSDMIGEYRSLSDSRITKYNIPQYPKWFEEVVEKEFVWTDELVGRCIATIATIPVEVISP